jgi:hypothetical protein
MALPHFSSWQHVSILTLPLDFNKIYAILKAGIGASPIIFCLLANAF